MPCKIARLRLLLESRFDDGCNIEDEANKKKTTRTVTKCFTSSISNEHLNPLPAIATCWWMSIKTPQSEFWEPCFTWSISLHVLPNSLRAIAPCWWISIKKTFEHEFLEPWQSIKKKTKKKTKKKPKKQKTNVKTNSKRFPDPIQYSMLITWNWTG